MACFKYYTGFYLEGLRKTITSARIAGIGAEICTRDLSNSKEY
jgi:hypothetical protein